ncbi:MAG TPA: DNA mismatch repair protein MutS [Myxococcales bacterium]|nr:DNA mismatch repair protein MutS [Myxococcales bacterium]
MMQQWQAAKSAHPDALLFFRMGDFYELFGNDAVVAARALELTLTSRDKNKEDGLPMAGVPHHAAQGYLTRLLELGYKVAVCDQVEDPKKAKGIVKRAVTRVVTPGVVLEESVLDPSVNNYLCAVWPGLEGYGVIHTDVTTGSLRGTVAVGLSALLSELGRLEPAEVLLPPESEAEITAAIERFGGVVTHLSVDNFNPGQALAKSEKDAPKLIRCALGAVGSYLHLTRPVGQVPLMPLEHYSLDEHLMLEETAFRNLEVVRTLMGGRRKGSLLGLLDKSVTAMGARQLRRWLQYPLRRKAEINERLDAVSELKEDAIVRDELRSSLSEVYDIERLGGRVVAGVASPKDLCNLRSSLSRLGTLKTSLSELQAAQLTQLAERLDPLSDLQTLLENTLCDAPAQSAQEGRLIRSGFDAKVDELSGLADTGKDWILQYEAAQRERSTIASLKVRFNRVFGYFIEVTRANLHLVPDDYIRKQTISTGERFYTIELKEYETKVLSAEERRIQRETELFEALRDQLKEHASRILRSAGRVADLDVLCALAEVAHRYGYVRPHLFDDRRINLKNSRHPVVEQSMGAGEFVPNDLRLDDEHGWLHLITGPNMAGKSTVMRQVAVTVLMAQIGSFVAADEAEIGLVDRIFTRVGATDDLSRGQSTFMVEMSEAAFILSHATQHSLIILDEIGRGTSTFDGLSIAWAVAEYVHDHLGARTLFATHYHELTELARSKESVRNCHVAVREWNDEVVFLRKLQPGATNRSYGIQVGRLAGLPESVIVRAKEVLAQLEQSDVAQPRVSSEEQGVAPQLGLFAPEVVPQCSELEGAVARVDVTRTTPLEALRLIDRWQKKLKQ